MSYAVLPQEDMSAICAFSKVGTPKAVPACLHTVVFLKIDAVLGQSNMIGHVFRMSLVLYVPSFEYEMHLIIFTP